MTLAVGRDSNGAASSGQLSPKQPVAGYQHSPTQLETVVPYTRDRGMQLVRIYCDECGSDLQVDGRSGLQQMFRDIESGESEFDALLLVDSSRWSRGHGVLAIPR